jgi:hypothetical protein
MDQNELLKELINFHEKTMECLSQERQGHTPDWQGVQNISDSIEDDWDLEAVKEFID